MRQHPQALWGAVIAVLALVATSYGVYRWNTESTLRSPLGLGVYAGPAAKGVAGVAAFNAILGAHSTEVLDFAAGDNWYNLQGPPWLLDPHRGQPERLELSVPMLPADGRATLAECAAGQFDAHWSTLASHLVAAGLAGTIVRPGWEFNGSWYRWGAALDPSGYAGCFRHLVSAMRATPGSAFAFDWNVTVGLGAFPAERAYPGDGFVDFVGVDVYDVSSTAYVANNPSAAARAATWHYLLDGDHGLDWWSRFAHTHHKSLAIPEWGVARLADGHGGGDDPEFVDRMIDFMTDPHNRVAYEHYFNAGNDKGSHLLTGGAFPASIKRLRLRLRALS